jgi:carbonic anhydrase/acetyltransferase-like protein (isoleucine patch superfamily)
MRRRAEPRRAHFTGRRCLRSEQKHARAYAARSRTGARALDWQSADFAQRYPGAQIRPYEGRWPRIDVSAWIAPGATVVGDVEIGRDSSVWYGCVLRGDVHAIRVGARTNIQDLSVLHVTKDRFPCEVGDEVTVGHRAVVHGCRIGDGALVGIGAVALDGAQLGPLAWLAAGALLAPGAAIAARMLAVGTPAKPVRELREAELVEQRERTLEYVRTAGRHRASGAR